jgi:DNA polymerase elongation subunit (family B)
VPASKFSTIWKKSSSASSATTSHLPTSQGVRQEQNRRHIRYQQYIDADIRNHPTKKAHRKIELVAQLLNMVSNRHYLSPLSQGDEMSQIGLTVNQWVVRTLKYVFVVGGCDKVPDCETTYKTEEAMIKGFIKRFLEIDPDIVTGYNIMGFDFMYIYKRATEISGTSSTCWKWGGSDRDERKHRLRRALVSALPHWATTS